MIPSQSKPVEVTLDCPRVIVYDQRAEFRMGSLERPFSVSDLKNKRRCWSALVAWIWACLSENDAGDFPSPESLAEYIKDDGVIKAAFTAFAETYSASLAPVSKKAEG